MGADIFAVRGAVAPVTNSKDGVFQATERLLEAILSRNRLELESIVFAFFTVTADLNAAFPAAAARAAGWSSVPMMCAVEIPVRGALPACIRVLLLCRARRPQRSHLPAPCPDGRRPIPLAGRLAAARRRRRRHGGSLAPGAAPPRPIHVYLGEAATLRPDLVTPEAAARPLERGLGQG
ncbi:MAG: chorismate mutase [Betaproteobacteria bacterium]